MICISYNWSALELRKPRNQILYNRPVMVAKRKSFNAKRTIIGTIGQDEILRLQKNVCYGGNPEHKRNPGDFGLTPPSSPRPDKTLCDGANIFDKNKALGLLKEGIRRGLVSAQKRGNYPQNIWAVTEEGRALEAQLENQSKGMYHGYPMPEADPFCHKVLEKWSATNEQ